MAVLDNAPIVGKTLLDSLIIRLYSNPRTIFREYVQNACDSIYEAVRCHVLSAIEEGQVVININAAKRQIEIQDNGMGIPRETALSTLMDIFHSNKDGIASAGQYGIGRLAGGGYCKELIFRTTALGETEETQLTLDIQLLKDILNDPSDDRSAEQVMQHICTASTNHVSTTDHYMIVCLKDITTSADILLDEEDITEYIRDIAPIDYQVPFKQLINMSIPTEYKDRYDAVRHIHVAVNNNSNLQKRYGLKIKGNGDEIQKLRFFSFSTPEYGSLAWGWYAVTPFSVQIPADDKSRGIRLRKLNISLDTDILNGYFKEDRGNAYFYGEIFIDNDNIKPNSGRQGLSSGDETEALIKEMKTYFKELTKVYSKANTIKNKLQAIQKRYDDYNEKKEILSQSEAEISLSYLNNDITTFKNTIDNTNYSENVKDVCEIYLAKYNENLKDHIAALFAPETTIPMPTTPAIQSSADSSKSKISSFTQENSSATATTDTNTSVSTHTDIYQPTRPTTSTTPQVTTSIPSTNTTVKRDAFQRLQEAGFSQHDIALSRRIFGYMNILCPPANKKLLEQLKEKTIDSLITDQK